ncbi:MAG: hypothetical protein HY096_09510 [Nitrospinae bacterium]|nr:hypothetical protein [Nitrospinota bacterium]
MSKLTKACVYLLVAVILMCRVSMAYAWTTEYLGPSISKAGYDYGSSFMYGDGPYIKSWWCGQKPGSAGDHIYYSEWYPTGWTTPEVVLTPGEPWATLHVCDPSVIKGSFTYNGTNYSYAMYYTGARLGGGPNGDDTMIGVALSNDGKNWVKYSGNPIIGVANPPSTGYGAGQPSAWTPDGRNVWIVYLDSTMNNEILFRESADAIHFGGWSTTQLKQGSRGLQSPDISYSGIEHRWYAAMSSGDLLNVILLRSNDDNLFGSWTEIGFFNGTNTGATHNHNPGLLRVPNGNLYVESGTDWRYVQFGCGWSDPSIWDLHWGRFKP